MVIYRLIRLLVYMYRKDEDFRFLLHAMGVLLILSTLFFSWIEGWRLLDSFYFCVMTISTIGYGDFAPGEDVSKLYTVIMALIGIGTFVALVTKIAEGFRKGHHYRRHGKLPDSGKDKNTG